MNRREMLKLSSAGTLAALTPDASAIVTGGAAEVAHSTIPQWEVFEVGLAGPSSGNPFTDVHLTATFSMGNRTVAVDGFYDGNGVYRVRFYAGYRGAVALHDQQ